VFLQKHSKLHGLDPVRPEGLFADLSKHSQIASGSDFGPMIWCTEPRNLLANHEGFGHFCLTYSEVSGWCLRGRLIRVCLGANCYNLLPCGSHVQLVNVLICTQKPWTGSWNLVGRTLLFFVAEQHLLSDT